MTSEPIPAAVKSVPVDWTELVKTLAAGVGILSAPLWLLLSRWVKARRQKKLVRSLEGKAIRYVLDADRQVVHALLLLLDSSRTAFIDLSEIQRQKVLIDQVRDELWIADGHDGEREAQRRAEEILQVLTRTQAIRAKHEAQEEARKAGEPPMFKEYAE